MLIAENITKKFSGVTALDNVCLELHAGKVNAIIGENGAGKSTLMKILSGVYAEYDGRIVYKSQPVRFQNPSVVVVGILHCRQLARIVHVRYHLSLQHVLLQTEQKFDHV